MLPELRNSALKFNALQFVAEMSQGHANSRVACAYYIVKYDMSKELERCAFLVRSKLEIGSQIMNQPA